MEAFVIVATEAQAISFVSPEPTGERWQPGVLRPPRYARVMSRTDVVVEEITDPSPEDRAALSGLLPHLSSVDPPDADALASIARSSATTLLCVRIGGRIVGTLTLVTFPLLTGVRAWIEDVVVEPEARGRGVATALIEEALRRAKRQGSRTVELTSRPSRTEANRLYERLGFERRETNVYRKTLSR